MGEPMTLPKRYAYLAAPDAPRLIREGIATLGTLEAPGKKNNPQILAWAKEIGVDTVYTADSIPWCGLWMAVIAKRSGQSVVKAPLWALSWATFGQHVKEAPAHKVPALGDILTFTRNGGGHVGLYVGEDKTAYHVLGGNQSDAVTITRILKTRFYSARRPVWRVSQPASVRPVTVGASGPISTNEA